MKFCFFQIFTFHTPREKKVYNRSLVLVSISKEKTTNYHNNNNSQQSFSSSFIIFLSLVFSHLSSSLISRLLSSLFLLSTYLICTLTRFKNVFKFGGKSVLAPVTPFKDTQYTYPLAILPIMANLSSVVVGDTNGTRHISRSSHI